MYNSGLYNFIEIMTKNLIILRYISLKYPILNKC
jgi:hypothetical protein